MQQSSVVVVNVVFLFHVHGKHLRSCRDGLLRNVFNRNNFVNAFQWLLAKNVRIENCLRLTRVRAEKSVFHFPAVDMLSAHDFLFSIATCNATVKAFRRDTMLYGKRPLFLL